MGRLVILLTSPRVAPGLLSLAAWEAVRAADRVLCGDPEPPVAEALRQAGVPVEVGGADAVPGAAEAGDVVWLAAGEDVASEIAGTCGEVLPGSYDLPGARMVDLVRVMDRLRTSCPWDRKQTHRSLVGYLLEETYETLEAVESGDRAHLREELGDLLLQVVFHARIAEEDAEVPWTVDDVTGDIVAKLVRRHPHVFAGASVSGAEEVESNWEQLKAAEKRRASVLDGVPLGLPALTLAAKARQRARRVGVPVPDAAAYEGVDIGPALFGLVAAAAEAGVDPEQALRDEVRRFAGQVRAAEAAAVKGPGEPPH